MRVGDRTGPRAGLRLALLAALALAAAVQSAGCGGSAGASGTSSSGKLEIVAAENVWGSIAAQLGGKKVAVTSIIANPNTDPHAYEPTASDGIAIARSRMAIVTGIGYDRWASNLLAANASSGRAVLDVGHLIALKTGANQHQWYSPASVERVVAAIVADYKRLDPRDASYFDRRRAAFETVSLASYRRLLAEIRARFAGVPVGYSESIFEPLAQSLGLRLMTPSSFAKAIAEGADVSAEDAQTVERQIETHAIRVWVYNSQNATPEVQRMTHRAHAAGIPVATITETLSPANASFEQWQEAELTSLISALHEATGR